MHFDEDEIIQTIRMVEMEAFDIRTITMGISLVDCADSSVASCAAKVYDKVTATARQLLPVVHGITEEYGVPIIHERLAVTPVAVLAETCKESDPLPIAAALDDAAREVGASYVGGFSAQVHKGFTRGDLNVIHALPETLARTERICASVSAASTRAGINMDAVAKMGQIIKDVAAATDDRGGIGCAKLVVFANQPEDNPFMAGAMHGPGEPDVVINVGVSGPGVVRGVLERLGPGADLGAVAERIKETAFKITRAGELVGRQAAQRLGVEFGIVDLSLAPTPAVGDSIADILELMGLERTGAPGSTCALALLTDAVKKGGAMAASNVGGLSGAFIPISEDGGMIRAVLAGALSLEKLEAMTSVCSVGLDMVGVPGDTPAETLAGIIADELAIGVCCGKTTGVRIIPVPGCRPGQTYDYGGLLGQVVVQEVNRFSPLGFISRGGRVPAPLRALTN